MSVDHITLWLDEPRSVLTTLMTPVVLVADLPHQLVRGSEEMLAAREEMRERINKLETELILLRARTEKMVALSAENKRLRVLLSSAKKLEDHVLVAELIGIDPNPDKQLVTIDKGTRDDVYVDQPVIDAEGLIGQVIEVSRFSSRVLLISDRAHSIPVQTARSSLRLIAQGTGITRQL
ncbi:MAG: rod shape-determining protein MreC, partial [Pseudomonadales bacterium]